MSDVISFAKGQSFSVMFALTPEDYEIVNTWDIKCQLRKFANSLPNGLVTEFVPIWIVTPETEDTPSLHALLLYVADTSGWPIGKLELDFVFSLENEIINQVVRSEIAVIDVQRSVTRGT